MIASATEVLLTLSFSGLSFNLARSWLIAASRREGPLRAYR
jgi:hypothetical protein